MIALFDEKRDDLAKLCAQYGVMRLELFGSALDVHFDEVNSDIDFLVEFNPAPVRGYADRYFGLLEALEAMFRRPIDLLEARALTNPYFLQSIRPTRVVLYAA